MMAQPNIQQIFQQVDRNRSGQIEGPELQMALQNGVGTQFNMKTIDLMICMFDRDGNGNMNMQEFAQLFNYVQQWMSCFKQYDRDGSGTISCQELHHALSSFGFRLSPQFISLMIRKFDRTRRGQIAFDDFMLACVCLQLLRMSLSNKRVENFEPPASLMSPLRLITVAYYIPTQKESDQRFHAP
ncbi:hypothetical protein CRM22_004091 [Opisthorchis felineus]|uniref:EF-hand domain-containing protein n=1 Tax=Opisthorchis felineus TaxID=147828 RepID=A0A4S2LXY4_OPIFE|nr:hypothetical protein CRM22_004091 [Opisthorchis felineus]